jgi:hypothetical protein
VAPSHKNCCPIMTTSSKPSLAWDVVTLEFGPIALLPDGTHRIIEGQDPSPAKHVTFEHLGHSSEDITLGVGRCDDWLECFFEKPLRKKIVLRPGEKCALVVRPVLSALPPNAENLTGGVTINIEHSEHAPPTEPVEYDPPRIEVTLKTLPAEGLTGTPGDTGPSLSSGVTTVPEPTGKLPETIHTEPEPTSCLSENVPSSARSEQSTTGEPRRRRIPRSVQSPTKNARLRYDIVDGISLVLALTLIACGISYCRVPVPWPVATAGTLAVAVDPEVPCLRKGAPVFLNGEKVGQVPCTVPRQEGEMEVDVWQLISCENTADSTELRVKPWVLTYDSRNNRLVGKRELSPRIVPLDQVAASPAMASTNNEQKTLFLTLFSVLWSVSCNWLVAVFCGRNATAVQKGRRLLLLVALLVGIGWALLSDLPILSRLVLAGSITSMLWLPTMSANNIREVSSTFINWTIDGLLRLDQRGTPERSSISGRFVDRFFAKW